MQQTSAAGNNRRRRRSRRSAGFTLLELLLALGIAALIAAIALPALRPSPVAELRSSAQLVAAALRQTRVDAMDRGRSLALLVDTETRSLQQQGAGAVRRLPDDLRLTLNTAEREMLGPYRGGIRFWPDGSATGGRVTLDKEQLRVRVDVEWLTGRVRISDVEGG